ncbi:MAG: dihydrodipicolinate synthase family protein, partial [Bryobacteraceae bacterium]
MNWKGVMPAMTTCFDKDGEVDIGFMQEHCKWLLDNGCTGLVSLGSLGEGTTLLFEEKLRIVRAS